MPTKKAEVKVAKVEDNLPAIAMRKQGRGFEEFDNSEDLIVPYVKIMQPLSPEVQDDEVEAKQGDLLNSLTSFNYGTKLTFVPLSLRKRRIKWIERDDGGGIDCASQGGIKPDTGSRHSQYCRECPNAQWQQDNPPACDMIYNFPSILIKEGLEQSNRLAMVSFTRSSFRAGKQLINRMVGAGGDMFGRSYDVQTKKTTNDKGTFYELITNPSGVLNPAEFKEAEAWYEIIQSENVRYEEVKPENETENGEILPF